MNIILASKSIRRKKILEKLNIKFEIINSNYNESKIKSLDLSSIKICKELAFKKAETVSNLYCNDLIIGADTIVIHKNKLLDKPKDKYEAFNHLSLLSENTHYVYTAVHILNKKKNINQKLIDKTKVTFNKLSENDITYYIDNFNPFDKAGSYGIQDWSSIFVNKIDGCFYNVVGFPLSKFYKLFKHYFV